MKGIAAYFVVVAGLLLQTVSAAQPQESRDEGLARRFVQCALLQQYLMERYTRPESLNERYASAARQQRDLLYAAAALKSDGTFVKSEIEPARLKVVEILSAATEPGKPSAMLAKLEECTNLFVDVVVPMVKAHGANEN